MHIMQNYQMKKGEKIEQNMDEIVTENSKLYQDDDDASLLKDSSDNISLNESISSDSRVKEDSEITSIGPNLDDLIERESLKLSEGLTASNSEISESSEILTEDFNFEILACKPKEELLSIIKETFEKRLVLEEENKRYQDELDQYKAENSTCIYQAHIETLEKGLAQAKADAFAWENELKNTKEKLARENITIRTELTSRLERVMKQCEVSNKDKESMVVKYAMAEKEVLVTKKQKENTEKRAKDSERDKEILQGKIKSLMAERARICSTLDNKIQESGVASRNIDKLKEEINAKDIKIKWGQTKLKAEIETHKETQARLDRALSKICNHEEEIQSTREEAEKIVKETKEGENTRANLLEKHSKETKASLILEKQKYDDVSVLYKQIKTEHETLRSSHILLDTEVTTLRVKVSKHEQEREKSEKLFESLQSELKNVKQRAADLSQRLSYSAVYAEQLESEKVKSGHAEQQIKDLQSRLEEQSVELAKCRGKEAELLVFTQKLTDKDVSLQSQLTASQGKVRLLEVEHNEMQTQAQKRQTEVAELTKQLSQLKESKKLEEERLSSLLLEKTKEATDLRTKVSDLLNEIQVQQKKRSNALKDSNREVQKLRRKLDSLENNSSPKQTVAPIPAEGLEGVLKNGESHSNWCQQESLSQESRASSDVSLNIVDSSHTNGNTSHQTPKDPTTASPISDLPQQVLIDRIIKLQKSAIKQSEKLEFLEEHVAQLVVELKKKNKIIHHYIMKEEPGALINSKSDYAKAEIIKHGGIMASVYGSTPKDGTMTLELSLEINKKLQAVLEDTLLKNITLKENLNTLGDEVAKLALQNSIASKPS